MKYTIKQKRDECIGCGACQAACNKFWKIDDDGLATLISSKKKGKLFERTIDEKDLECNKHVAEICPVEIIHIEDENGKKVI